MDVIPMLNAILVAPLYLSVPVALRTLSGAGLIMPMYRLAEVTDKALKGRKLGGTRLSTLFFF